MPDNKPKAKKDNIIRLPFICLIFYFFNYCKMEHAINHSLPDKSGQVVCQKYIYMAVSCVHDLFLYKIQSESCHIPDTSVQNKSFIMFGNLLKRLLRSAIIRLPEVVTFSNTRYLFSFRTARKNRTYITKKSIFRYSVQK